VFDERRNSYGRGGLDRPLADLRSVLIPGETLEAWAIQAAAGSRLSQPAVLIAAQRRLVVLVRRLLAARRLTGNQHGAQVRERPVETGPVH